MADLGVEVIKTGKIDAGVGAKPAGEVGRLNSILNIAQDSLQASNPESGLKNIADLPAEKKPLDGDEEQQIESVIDNLISDDNTQNPQAEQAELQNEQESLLHEIADQLKKMGISDPLAQTMAEDVQKEVNEKLPTLPEKTQAKLKKLLAPQNIKKAAALGGIFTLLFLVTTIIKAGGEK